MVKTMNLAWCDIQIMCEGQPLTWRVWIISSLTVDSQSQKSRHLSTRLFILTDDKSICELNLTGTQQLCCNAFTIHNKFLHSSMSRPQQLPRQKNSSTCLTKGDRKPALILQYPALPPRDLYHANVLPRHLTLERRWCFWSFYRVLRLGRWCRQQDLGVGKSAFGRVVMCWFFYGLLESLSRNTAVGIGICQPEMVFVGVFV